MLLLRLSEMTMFVYFLEVWIGGDDYDTAKICGEKVYQQLNSLKEIAHPITGQKLTVLRRSTADDKARRTSTGNSSACSTFPIPEAPEHIDQLGDIKFLFVEPTWNLEETESQVRRLFLVTYAVYTLTVNFTCNKLFNKYFFIHNVL